MATISRNDPCFCGSGKKYKNCHLGKAVEVKSPRFILPLILLLSGLGFGAYLGIQGSVSFGVSVAVATVIGVVLLVLLRDPPPPGKGGDPGAINFGR
jgi:hypothetical protein